MTDAGGPDDPVLYEEREGVAFITLNRPARKNAFTEQMVRGVAAAVRAASCPPATTWGFSPRRGRGNGHPRTGRSPRRCGRGRGIRWPTTSL